MSVSPSVVIDAAFPLRGEALPLDHGYPLFSALSRVLPWLHQDEDVGIHPVFGQRRAPGVLALGPRSWLKLRVPSDRLALILPVAGITLDVAGHSVSTGAPTLLQLTPAASLKSRFVTIKKFHDEPEAFKDAAERQLLALDAKHDGVAVEVGDRRVMKVAEHTIVGFPMAIHGLSVLASLQLQAHGIGGRRHMGAGIFVPFGKGA